MTHGNGANGTYVRPDQAARRFLAEMEQRGYNGAATDRTIFDHLPDIVLALGRAEGWPDKYIARAVKIARDARIRYGFSSYSDRTL